MKLIHPNISGIEIDVDENALADHLAAGWLKKSKPRKRAEVKSVEDDSVKQDDSPATVEE